MLTKNTQETYILNLLKNMTLEFLRARSILHLIKYKGLRSYPNHQLKIPRKKLNGKTNIFGCVSIQNIISKT